MKISDEMRFPYPVLSHATNDFLDGEFNVVFEVEERPSDGKLRLSYTCEVTEQQVQELVREDAVRIGLFITCLDTYFNQLSPLVLGKGELTFQGGLLNGR